MYSCCSLHSLYKYSCGYLHSDAAFLQQFQKVSHFRIFRWVTNLKPFFDIHFAPFKPVHCYWFGVLPLTRGILLVIFSSSFTTPNNTNRLLLLALLLVLLLYIAIIQLYKNKINLICQISFLAKILFLGMFAFYVETCANKHKLWTTGIGIFIGVTFFQFCGIIICNVFRHTKLNSYRDRAYLKDEEELDKNFSTNYHAYIMKAPF